MSPGTVVRYGLAILATWRLTHLLAQEDGPGDIVVRVRGQLGNGSLGRLLDCFYCLSLWIAAPAALFVARRPLEWAFAWLAISGAACLLERTGQTRTDRVDEVTHGVLRRETHRTDRDGEPAAAGR